MSSVLRTAARLGLLALLSACAPASAPQTVWLPTSSVQAPLKFNAGAPVGGQLQLKLQLPGAFRTQLLGCTVAGDLKSLRIFLLNGAVSLGDDPPFGGLLVNFDSRLVQSFSVNTSAFTSGVSQTLSFENVPPGDYYIAIAGFDAVNGGGANISSLLSGLLSGGNLSGEGLIAISDGGGDPNHPGRVSIGPAPHYPITNNSAEPLRVTLRLGELCLL